MRDCSSNIVQFIYGEDGMAGEFLEQCTIQKFLEMKDREFEKEFRFYDNLDQRDISEKFQEYEKFLDPVVTFF